MIGPDRALYFCDLDNQRIRRLDLRTRRTTTIAGNGQKAIAVMAARQRAHRLNMPHELQFDASGNLYIAERDNHVIRKVDAKTGVISTFAGTGDRDSPATADRRTSPASPASQYRRGSHRPASDLRYRESPYSTGGPGQRTIETYGRHGRAEPTPDGAPVKGTPLNGPRTIALDRDGDLYLALREGNAIYRIDAEDRDDSSSGRHRRAGLFGGRGPARLAKLAGPKGLAYAGGTLYVADTENHVVRRIELKTGIITTVLGTGQRGDGPSWIRFAARCRGRMGCSWMLPVFCTSATARPTAYGS